MRKLQAVWCILVYFDDMYTFNQQPTLYHTGLGVSDLGSAARCSAVQFCISQVGIRTSGDVKNTVMSGWLEAELALQAHVLFYMYF